MRSNHQHLVILAAINATHTHTAVSLKTANLQAHQALHRNVLCGLEYLLFIVYWLLLLA